MIYAKTQLGQTVFHNRSVSLTPRQRSTFIMFDGKRNISEVLNATTGLGVTTEDVSHLVSLGLLEPAMAAFQVPEAPVAQATSNALATAAAVVTVAIEPPSIALTSSPDDTPALNAQVHYLTAYPIATRLTANLGLWGFRLNLAVEAAGSLDKLKELAPRIKDAIGPEKFRELEHALYN